MEIQNYKMIIKNGKMEYNRKRWNTTCYMGMDCVENQHRSNLLIKPLPTDNDDNENRFRGLKGVRSGVGTYTKFL